ncbi:sigma-54 interaction domain-containing protein [Desulfosediminicola ganghwensis]|uniref:sigma-54 interaction domain-containing protein n=1 Tax=Desulfosediminicola ganghwensis TaxID=2569540 RepID=UPI0010AC7626|nr:sigma-54 dependent transcriptional regulator [Desulfosediminicola ganghwensis]
MSTAGVQKNSFHWLIVKDVNQPGSDILRRALSLPNLHCQHDDAHKPCAPISGIGNHTHKMVGSTPQMIELHDLILQVAPTDTTVLITGESGTGKEIVADLLQELSSREKKPYLKINCNAFNDSILESELFGHEKGAFTGAESRKKGKFEIVDGGTIFLDEIGDISPRMQSSLLRVLQDGEIIRVGGNHPIKINIRIIAATNTDLATAIQREKFRLDLFYRLNIIHIPVPPLRERKDDIRELTFHFIRKFETVFNKQLDSISESALSSLMNHDWPGNVRELENLIQRAVLIAKTNEIVEKELVFTPYPRAPARSPSRPLPRLSNKSLKSMLSEFERDIILQALRESRGNVAAAAESLQLGKTSLYEKMKRFGISSKDIFCPVNSSLPSQTSGKTG